MTEVVRLVIGKGKPIDQQERYKIIFKSKELRLCAEQTGKGVLEHLNEPTGGWQTALFYGLKYAHPKLNKDQVSEIIDRWLEDDPDTNEYPKIGDMLMQALENGRFIKIKAGSGSDEAKDDDEGNQTAQN
jgi:hypothetical protein